MSFAVFNDPNRGLVADFLCFARGKGILSEHATKPEADRALAAYLKAHPVKP